MESDNEYRPLLRTLSRPKKRNILQRIPSEVTITGIILVAFLSVVTLLLLIENIGSDQKKELTLENDLLGSAFKYNKKATFKPGEFKRAEQIGTTLSEKQLDKVRYWMDEWRNSYNVENFEDSLEKRVSTERKLYAYMNELRNASENQLLQKSFPGKFESSSGQDSSTVSTLLGTSFKYNKKKPEKKNDEKNVTESDLDPKWDKKKEKFLKEYNKLIKKFQNFLKKHLDADEQLLDSWKELQESSKQPVTIEEFLEKLDEAPYNLASEDITLLGSPFKYNKKSMDETWQNKKKHYAKNLNKKWNDASIDWAEMTELLNNYLISTDKEQSEPEIRLLGSPFKYNKKAFDTTWQVNKYPVNSFNNENKWDSVNKGWKKIYPLGSSIKNENTEENVPIENVLTGSDVKYGSKKWDSLDKGWKQVSEKGNKVLEEVEKFYDTWKSAEKQLKSQKENILASSSTKNSNRSVEAPSGCPFSSMGNNLLKASAVSESQVDCALLAEQVRRELGKCIDLSFLPKECKPVWRTKCFSTYKYRKIDGSCNNQIHPTWGKSGTPYVRMIAPEYGDGVSSIRSSKSGGNLPNARYLSRELYSIQLKPDIDVSLLFLYFGLLIDHDMLETAINRDNIPCCADRFEKYPQNRPKECIEIPVGADDPFYGPRKVKCLSVVRSLPVHGECVGRREQLNTATSYLDGSVVYGSTIQKTKSLRSFNKGQLKTQYINNTPYMASSAGSGYECGTPSKPYKCFNSGDTRVNMLVELVAMHTLWYREHNRLAEELHKINPKWTDETLFQEARRILIAEIQHITYNEFLPFLLGNDAMDFFEISIKNDEYYDGYDDTINPSVFNVFASSAFRFGHSLAQDMIALIGPDNKTVEEVPLHRTYFNPEILHEKGIDFLLRGSISQQQHSVDSFITKELREHLFQAPDKDFGHDLAAVGIQRGRDHGLPGYTKWRSACGLPAIESWDDLISVMNIQRASKLKEVYESVEDIDLTAGALAEEHVPGSLLGPTHLCIIGRQFRKTRKGDRLWFEKQDKIGSFTLDQLKQIYNSNMARIICDNSDNIQSLQKYPFAVPSTNNPIIRCEDTPQVNLSEWKSKY